MKDFDDAAVAEALRGGLERAAEIAAPRVRGLVGEALRGSLEWASLLGGRLRAELGLADASRALDEITDATTRSVRVTASPAAGDFLGGVTAEAVRSDYRDVLSLPGASYPNLGRAGGEIPWLEWLIFGGDRVLVAGSFFHAFAGDVAGSRSGRALMVTRKDGRGEWSVPPEFAGTPDDNLLTRAVEERVEDILAAMADSVRGAF